MNPILKLLLRPTISAKEIHSAFGMSKETFRKKIAGLRPFLNGDSKRKRIFTQEEFRFLIDNVQWEKDKATKKAN